MKKLALGVLLSAALTAFAQLPGTAAPADPAINAGRKALTEDLNSIAYKYLAARRETMAKITTREQAEQRQREVRAKILGLIGSLPERIPLNPRITGSTEMEGFRVDKVLFDSQPNFPITALLYVPAEAKEGKHNFPAIVMAPGHSPAGKSGDVAMATQFAKVGFVVLSYDPIGQGERLQYLDPKSPTDKPVSFATRPTGEHGEAGLQPTLIGDALARYFLWDGMRAVDYLETVPSVDTKRIGAFGCSGGGTMTALLSALDPRIAVAGVACYTTSFDALLPSATGVQDSEQSTPGFIAAGLDFPDWSEQFAPKPYAIIATTSDMFPFEGVKVTEAESRRFYSLFGASDHLAFITGPGGHGNLRPITPQILHFFADHLHPDAIYAKALPPVTDPFDEKANPARKPGERPAFPPAPPVSLTQVSPTGQLSSSYPGVATVFTLNRARAEKVVTPHLKTLGEAQKAVREVTHARASAGKCRLDHEDAECALSGDETVHVTGQVLPASDSETRLMELRFEYKDGSYAKGLLATPASSKPHDGELLLSEGFEPAGKPSENLLADVIRRSKSGHAVLALEPRPSPEGTEETKSPILGPFYLTELRAELSGRTLVGLRIDDTVVATNYLSSLLEGGSLVHVSAEASGHLGLVLLHAAVLDPRLTQASITGALASYRGFLQVPLPMDAPQDEIPAVLRHYDLPDLVRILGARVAVHEPGKI